MFFNFQKIDARILAAENQQLQARVKITAWIAFFMAPVTITAYLFFFFPEHLQEGFFVSLIGASFVLLVLLGLTIPFFQRRAHLLLFILALSCQFFIVGTLQITNGDKHFLFPYMLIFFGVAAYMHGNAGWILATLFSVPLGYAVFAGLQNDAFTSKAVMSNLMYLTDVSILAFAGNRMMTRLSRKNKMQQIELEEANQKLIEMDKIRSGFFANISHELKTPITVITTQLENILENKNGEIPNVVLQKLQAHCLSPAYLLSALIEDLLELAKSQVGKIRLRPILISNPEQYFKKIFDAMIPLMEKKQLHYEFKVENDLQPFVFDDSKMDKILINLFSNAIKFDKEGGKIVLKLWQSDNQFFLSVSDTGIGIPEDRLKDIFERFMQIDSTSTQAEQGMGIGLSLVKLYTELHQGTIQVKSQLSQGSTFVLQIPMNLVPDSIEQESSSEYRKHFFASTPQTSKKKTQNQEVILIVEDHQELKSVMEEILAEDYQILHASNGEEGYQVALQEKPHLIISDIMMPKMDGITMLRQLREHHAFKEIPVILLTAKGTDDLVLGFEAGANDYLTKPFSPLELRLRIKNLLLFQKQKNELIKTQAELIRKETLCAVGELAAGVAHNVATFMGGADLGLSSVYEKVKKDPELSTLVHTCLESVRNTKSIITCLDNFSQKNQKEENFRQGSLQESMTQAIQMMRLHKDLEAIQIEPCFEMKSEHLYCNPQQLNAAFLNLLKNATQSGARHIRIRTWEENASAVVSIQDDGCGIPSKLHSRIFEPFFTTRDVGEGRGLGLWMVHRTVEEHGGSIHVKSEEGEGAEFILRIPKVVEEKQDVFETRPGF